VSADAKARRAAFTVPAPDPTNLAAALERQEIRAHIRTLAPAERLPFALKSKDQRILESVHSAPRAPSGFTEQDFDLLFADTQTRLHGPAIEEVDVLESDIAEAHAVTAVAQGDIQRGSGFAEKQFSEIIGRPGPNEIPWLRRDGARVLVVRPGKSMYPEASADEVSRGKFYANLEEYEKDQAA
jgi:hypothetical protein